jgi:eukaryotic-like serine/threonine-protein kinase
VEAAPEQRELAPGTMLDDKYRIESLLAIGGMGAVYVGTHTRLRKKVAIKILNPQLSSAQMIERFHREAITASQIGHEGIAQVTDIGTSAAGEPFLVMEYLEGESLASRMRASGPLPIEVACELGCAILSPLSAAHQAGIVHRDLKPDNVFLVRQSRGEMVKLLDFGISRASTLEGEFRLTTTGLVLGTPYYMSPEQARGDTAITPAADIYAFGVILYEMLVGDVPIRGDNYNQLMYRVMTGEYVRPSVRRADIPPGLEQLIVGAMASEPTQRPPSAADLERALLAFCRPTFRDNTIERMSAASLPFHRPTPAPLQTGRVGPGTDQTVLAPTPAPTLRTKRSKVPLIVGLLVLLAGATTVVAMYVLTDGDESPKAAPLATNEPVKPPPSPPAPTPPAPPPQAADTKPVAAETITLKFAVEPKGAAITVDDKPVTGSELAVPRDSAKHKLVITAPGYATHDEELDFTESQRLVVQLKKGTTSRPTGTKRPKDPKNPKNERIESESPYK